MSKGHYLRNKAAAIFINTEPTMTDQSGARETDINIIVGKMGISGQGLNQQQEGSYGDFTAFPADLRETIELARSLETHRARLPEQLRDKTTEQLLSLTADDLHAILTPPTPAPTEEKK